MAIGESGSEHRHLVARMLASIPTHEEPPLSLSQITARVSEGWDSLNRDHLELATSTILVVLSAFDVLKEQHGLYRFRSDMSMYFTRSLAWYIANRQQVVTNWMRAGVGDDLSIHALLDAGPYLLRLMEDKRLHIARPHPEPLRTRHVACVLVKTQVDDRALYLFEWDREAAQYQMIGGHIETDEEPRTAAAQELIEEVVTESGRKLVQGRHFDIRPLDWERPLPLEWMGVSRTVGALTRYKVWAYGVQLKMGRLTLRGDCRWLHTDEMFTGRTASGHRTDNPALYRLIDAGLTGGLVAVPVSISGVAITGSAPSGEPPKDARPSVFIGHGRSTVWRELAEHLRGHHGYQVIAFDSEPGAGRATTDILGGLIHRASFAVLVHTAEDEQPDGGLRARQNVVHETGLFQGRLGFTRAIVVRERGCEAFSNLAGLQELHYTTEISEAFGEVVAALRREFG